jgi:hypothetical protein
MLRKSSLFAFFLFFLIAAETVFSQELEQMKKTVFDLAGEKMHGRGYIKNGHLKAADYIAKEYQKIGLQSFKQNYFQEFSFSVNNIKSEPFVSLDNKQLTCGQDFLIQASCKTFKGEGFWVKIDSQHIAEKKLPQGFEGKWIVADAELFHPVYKNPFDPKLSNEFFKAKGFIILQKKLTHSVSTLANFPLPIVEMKKSVFENQLPEKIKVNYKTLFVSQNTGKNVIGYVKGTKQPEKFFVFTGHYDHLGMQGKKATFYGANDNAAGIALLLELAKYYKKNPPEFSVAFMAFGGEELGLLGSRHYVFEPYFPLEKIVFLVNLDLVGTGDDGLMAVNGSVFKEDFEKIVKINTEKNYFSKVQHRPKAANSDHYFFTEKGVPSFFIYLMGGTQAYHDIHDRPEQLPLTKTGELMNLLKEFVLTFEENK